MAASIADLSRLQSPWCIYETCELSSVLTWTAKKHGIFFYVTGFCFYTSFPSFTWIYFTSATFQSDSVCVFPVIKKKLKQSVENKGAGLL